MAESKHKTVLTTGQVARICNVAPRTVSKWFDSGQLRGYRIPGSKDRRIPVDQLLRFMRDHGIPTEGLNIRTKAVLIVDDDAEARAMLVETLGADGPYDVSVAASVFEAGVMAAKTHPLAIIIDVSLPDVHPRRLCQFLRSDAQLGDIKLVAVGGALTEGQGQGLLREGFAAYLRKPYDVRKLRQLVDELTK